MWAGSSRLPAGLPHEELTSQVLEAAYGVRNELGIGFLESGYEGALAIALGERGLKVERQVAFDVRRFDNRFE